jgi:superfamily II DNA or RNA helicase
MNRFMKNKYAAKKEVKEQFKPTEEYKNIICNASYLGKKGYTIPKALLSKEDEEYLRKELFVKPEVAGANFGPSDEASAFPVFRENINKFYIPRFYGIHRYGLPPRSEITQGSDINVTFTKPLRDYQEKIIDIYTKYVNTPICSGSAIVGSGGILEVPCGAGKCVGVNTPILMYDGTIKMVQDIKVGDVIMGDDSTPRNVLTLARGREMMYKVIPNKGDPYIVNESHILSLKYSSAVNKHTPKGTVIDMPVLDYLNLPKSYHGKGGVLVGYRVPIVFPKQDYDIEPYALGYWLGDGHSSGTGFTTEEAEVVEYFKNYAESLSCNIKQGTDSITTRHSLHYSFTGKIIENKRTGNTFLEMCRKNNLVNNKHIPHNYKCNDRAVQLEVLAGLIDSDGYYHDNCYEITQKNETLLDDILFVARSLGFAAYKTACKKYCMYKGEKREGTYYKASISGKGLEDIPVKCSRKKAHTRKQIKDALNTRIRLEKLDIDDYYGFEIDGNRRFVLGDFTVTHNTVMALKIISNLKKKTLIIVHKEFLMNQWIERIAEFLPGANVGKIQGQVFDIDGKDIVIGMVQTLYDKEFHPDAFSTFGLTIIDEVHRIGSEQFSRTLFKTITPYMLGISATVERKDKLTKVLYMFIGDKIYSEERKNDDLVCVRAINYVANDTEFNEVELDFRGNPKYSTMITKLCSYGPRSDFIIRVVGDLLKEDSEKQIMILCHNRSLLTYLYEGISHRDLASIGYYVGGMKQNALQETEQKQIVLATYAMAAEALDIKTLSTLIMVTPKTDITQSVGRILRVKHENPIIVDIVDKHDIFQNQWAQRRRFYKKCNYRIRQIVSSQYTGMSLDWDNDQTWKRVFEPKNTDMKVEECSEEEDSSAHQTPIKGSDKGKCMININFDD